MKAREIAHMVDRLDDALEEVPRTLADPHNEQLEALRQLKCIQILLWSISFALKQPDAAKERGSLDAGRKAFP